MGNSTNNGVGGNVYALVMNGTNQLFVGGSFTSVDGSSILANNIASWNGNSWSFLGTNSTNNGVNGTVYALAMNGTNQLFVGGQFSSANGGSVSANNIASWDGNSWIFLGANSTNNGVGVGGSDTVYALAMNGTNQLFVGGRFSSVDGGSISANNIASWDGNSWNILGAKSSSNGVNGYVYALAMNRTNQLFVGGNFFSVDGNSISANHIASWNGNSWNFLGSDSINNGVDARVTALVMNETNNLLVGGQFTFFFDSGGSTTNANFIASWNGSAWNTLGANNGVNGNVAALASNETAKLYVGGEFSSTTDGLVCSSFLVSVKGGKNYR